jgi:hypothetical protein
MLQDELCDAWYLCPQRCHVLARNGITELVIGTELLVLG